MNIYLFKKDHSQFHIVLGMPIATSLINTKGAIYGGVHV